MKTVLFDCIKKEKPNAAALGAFNSTVSLGYSTATSMLNRGDKEGAISAWRSAMVYGSKDLDRAKTKKERKAIISAYAQAIGFDRALKEHSK